MVSRIEKIVIVLQNVKVVIEIDNDIVFILEEHQLKLIVFISVEETEEKVINDYFRKQQVVISLI